MSGPDDIARSYTVAPTRAATSYPAAARSPSVLPTATCENMALSISALTADE